jgi:chromosomal replication initiator protein
MSQKYTFDSFVIGSSNRFAHAAALAVAEAPARRTTRSSSTAAPGSARRTSSRRSAQYVASTRALTVRYVTSETFMNDFINSLRDKRIEGFKQRYRTTTCC